MHKKETVIINKDAIASEESYKQENDVVRFNVTPTNVASRERLQYSFSDFTEESTSVNMEWEKIRVSFKVVLSTSKQAVENIDKTLGSTWAQYNNAARYYFDQKDYNKALEYVNLSLTLQNHWFNNWVKAQILAAKGMTKDAYAYATKAKELGDKTPESFWYKAHVEKAIEEWKVAGTGKKK